ncbi:hypothetical protein [Aquisalimonas sp.]|uniref:hypothetical protein n=1 Tax=Aquisalimonas sp. TaxID=1872621 RepID=UPI0025BB7B41|nr:hypothetical protein [Aquisalimonas sp.]
MGNRLALSLFILRVTVFVVMAMWSLDKLLAPDHAANVFESFYYLGGLDAPVFYAIGVIQLIIEIGFLLGVARFWTYGFVLVVHAISVAATWQQLLNPLDNMLFLASVPMLGACVALFLLRDSDNFLTLGRSSGKH